MISYILSGSKVEASMLTNMLKKQGLNNPRFITDFNAIQEKDSAEVVVFLDWENLSLDAAQKKGFLQQLHQKLEGHVVLVGNSALEGEIQAAASGTPANLLFKPLDACQVRSVLNKIRKSNFAKLKIDARVINAFISSVVTFYQTMIGLEPKRKKVFLLEPGMEASNLPDYSKYTDISSIMGLSGDYQGSAIISMPVKLALRTTALMLCEEEAPQINSDVLDCLGEIINIISGQAKATLSNTPYTFNLSLPTVVTGKGHKIQIHENSPTLILIFSVQDLEFGLQVNIRPK